MFFALSGCAGMTETQQWTLSGGEAVLPVAR
jgi:hypothetical protein